MALSTKYSLVTYRGTAAVAIPCFSLDRWDDLRRAIGSVRAQSRAPEELIIVVDHNAELLRRVGLEFPEARVIANEEQQGSSGARNTALAHVTTDIVAFLDDDVIAATNWLQELLLGYDDPTVLGVGGAITPRWDGARPRWFPPEFDWVIGCSYRGMPETEAVVRNFFGNNMSFRTEVLRRTEGFPSSLTRLGSRPTGGEETELCIRLLQVEPSGVLLYRPTALVSHRVPLVRATMRYFRARCFEEGRSKALLRRHVGADMALKAERRYALRVLPRAVLEALRAAIAHGTMADVERASAIVVGFALTSVGYIMGTLFPRSQPSPAAPPPTSRSR